MKTKFLIGLAAAALLIGQPVYAASHKGGGHPAASHHTTHAVAAVHRSVGHSYAAAHRSVSRSTAIAARRSFSKPASHSYTANINRQTINNAKIARNNMRGSRTSVAYGGNTSYVRGNNNSHGTYAFASHSGWSHGQEYYWHGHHYQWYGNGWFIIDPFPVGYGYWGPNTGYYYGSGTPVSVEVQAALQQQGYYRGPVDGIVGPGTQSAIAAYQRDNGLRVTGTITHGVLRDLGIG